MNKQLRIFLLRRIYKDIITETTKNTKIEAIALLFGMIRKNKVIITDLEPLKNTDNSATSFSVDYSKFIELITEYESTKKKTFLGFFHTHPPFSKAYPSTTDIEYMKFWPDTIWAISRTFNDQQQIELAFYLLQKDKIKKIDYEIITEKNS